MVNKDNDYAWLLSEIMPAVLTMPALFGCTQHFDMGGCCRIKAKAYVLKLKVELDIVLNQNWFAANGRVVCILCSHHMQHHQL